MSFSVKLGDFRTEIQEKRESTQNARVKGN